MCKTGQFRELVGKDSGMCEHRLTRPTGSAAEKMAGGSAEDEAPRPLLTHLRRVWVRKPFMRRIRRCAGIRTARSRQLHRYLPGRVHRYAKCVRGTGLSQVRPG